MEADLPPIHQSRQVRSPSVEQDGLVSAESLTGLVDPTDDSASGELFPKGSLSSVEDGRFKVCTSNITFTLALALALTLTLTLTFALTVDLNLALTVDLTLGDDAPGMPRPGDEKLREPHDTTHPPWEGLAAGANATSTTTEWKCGICGRFGQPSQVECGTCGAKRGRQAKDIRQTTDRPLMVDPSYSMVAGIQPTEPVVLPPAYNAARVAAAATGGEEGNEGEEESKGEPATDAETSEGVHDNVSKDETKGESEGESEGEKEGAADEDGAGQGEADKINGESESGNEGGEGGETYNLAALEAMSKDDLVKELAKSRTRLAKFVAVFAKVENSARGPTPILDEEPKQQTPLVIVSTGSASVVVPQKSKGSKLWKSVDSGNVEEAMLEARMNAVRAETKAKAAADAARPTGPTDRERDLQEELELVQFNLAAAEERNQETLEMRTTLSEVRWMDVASILPIKSPLRPYHIFYASQHAPPAALNQRPTTLGSS